MVESALLDDQEGLRSTIASGSSTSSSPRKARASGSGSGKQSRASNAGSVAATSPRKSRGSIPIVVTPQQQDEEIIQDGGEEKHDLEEVHSSGQSMLEEEQGEEIRLRRLNEGLVRFLGLVDVKAT